MVLSKKNILLLFEDPKFKDILINNVVVFENEVVIDIYCSTSCLLFKLCLFKFIKKENKRC